MTTMDIREIILQRRSIRRFRPDPVPPDLLRELLDLARWSPSWGNTQPWQVYVLTGEPLERFRQANQEQLRSGVAPAPEIEMPQEWPANLKSRYVGVGKDVLTALGIPREDKAARIRYALDMFGLFGAPCLIVVCVPAALPRAYAALDVGLFLQTFCLAAAARGIATCALAASVNYPQLLRRLAPVPEDATIVIGAAVGYPDADVPVNGFSRSRAGLDEFTVWVG